MTTTSTILSDCQILSRVNFQNILDELTVFLRNNLTDRRSRTSSTTDTFAGDGSTTTFTFTGDLDSKSRHKIMNVKSVTIDGTTQTNFEDYIVGYRKDSGYLGKIHFWNPPDNGVTIVVSYDWSSSFVYPEEPRIDLSTNHYPIVTVQVKEMPVEEAGVGGKAMKWKIPVFLTCVDKKRDKVEDMMNELVLLFADKSVREGFWNFRYIQPVRVSGIAIEGEEPNDAVYGQQYELLIPYEYNFSK